MLAIKATLAIVFVSFVFCYIHYMQCDMLALSQQILSNGHTHYNRTIGTIIITLAAISIQIAVSKVAHTGSHTFALTYLPSALLLCMLTDLIPNYSKVKLIIYIVMLAIIVVLLMSNIGTHKRFTTHHSMLNVFISNISIMTMIIIGIGLCGNCNALMHNELRAERYLAEGKFEKAATVTEKSATTSRMLVILRAYALSRTGQLNEKFFAIKIPRNLTTLLPLKSDSAKMIFKPENIFNWLGTMPNSASTPEQYLDIISAQPELVKSHPQILDYKIATYMLTRQIDKLAATIKAVCDSDSTSNILKQRHCREAVMLYQHLRTKPLITIEDETYEANYNDFTNIMRTVANKTERRSKLWSQYGDTYWYYYYMN